MKMIEDLAHEAFQASRDSDRVALGITIANIVSAGPASVDAAMQTWMDRLLVVLGDPFDDQGRIALAMTPDNSGTGETFTLDQLHAELAWVGRMFIAYTTRDFSAWRQLWAEVPFDKQTAYVARMLNTMARTTLAYEELRAQGGAGAPCCTIHAWIRADPAVTGARLAKAHLN